MLHAFDQKFDVMENLENFCELNKALVSQKICKISHRIFRRMHGVLNIDKNKNKLHSLVGIGETIFWA